RRSRGRSRRGGRPRRLRPRPGAVAAGRSRAHRPGRRSAVGPGRTPPYRPREEQLMRGTRALRALAGAVLTGAALLATAGTATADDPSASPGAGGEDGAPTAAGTTFRLA